MVDGFEEEVVVVVQVNLMGLIDKSADLGLGNAGKYTPSVNTSYNTYEILTSDCFLT